MGQVAKTRFKTWWQLCGYPVELVAQLIGEKIDIASLLSAAEKGEAETTAAAEILKVLMDAFPYAVAQRNGRVNDENKFFARDVSRLIAAGEKRSDGTEPQEADKERADRLRDAFSDLTGKRVMRTSAGAIGKLLNSRLAGRPVFVDIKDNLTVIAALRGETTRTKQAIFYIEIVSNSPAEIHAFPNPDGLYGSPSSPSSPANRPTSAPPAGDEGDEGDNFSRPDLAETGISHNQAPASPAASRPPTGRPTQPKRER